MTIRIGGSVIGGNSVTINGKHIVSDGDGMVIIGGHAEDLPKVHEEYDGVSSVQLSDCGTVSLQMGNKFVADGEGSCKKYGSRAILSEFSGDVTLPELGDLSVQINSGTVHGEVMSASVNAKVNSGSLSLSVKSKDHAPKIDAHVNSGNVTITVL